MSLRSLPERGGSVNPRVQFVRIKAGKHLGRFARQVLVPPSQGVLLLCAFTWFIIQGSSAPGKRPSRRGPGFVQEMEAAKCRAARQQEQPRFTASKWWLCPSSAVSLVLRFPSAEGR